MSSASTFWFWALCDRPTTYSRKDSDRMPMMGLYVLDSFSPQMNVVKKTVFVFHSQTEVGFCHPLFLAYNVLWQKHRKFISRVFPT